MCLWQLTLTIQNMPLPQRHEYECAFSSYGISRITAAVLLENAGKSVNRTVQCETPNSNLLPVIPTGQGKSASTLGTYSLVTNGYQVPFLSLSPVYSLTTLDHLAAWCSAYLTSVPCPATYPVSRLVTTGLNLIQ